MSYCSDIKIGDLVCIKSNYEEHTFGWVALEVEAGIVIEIIETHQEFYLYDYKVRCYDYVIYWAATSKTETLPDIIVEKYDSWKRRIDGRLR